MTRAQRVKQVHMLYTKGLSRKQIVEKTGLSTSYVASLFHDPSGSKEKARKSSYSGACETCGKLTSGSNGRAKAPKFCRNCSGTANFKIWTKSKIIAAIHEWNFIYGEPPVATDWNRAVEGSPGQYTKGPRSEWAGRRRWPAVQNLQNEFGSWANAIEAAGFPRPKVGHYRDESKRSQILTRWTKERVIAWMLENADGDIGPTSYRKDAPVNAATARFGSWVKAVEAAGLIPRGIARSTRR